MAIFYRINNNKLSVVGDTPRLGFNNNNALYIPDQYLEQQEFVVMRTCHGIGDWCIISAMPRLLKQKYPNSKVYVPSDNMLKQMFGQMLNNWGYGTFDCSKIPFHIFNNNPYVDDFIDNYYGEIFHDHYKIYDEEEDKIPLLEQMLKFWQFSKDEYEDSAPEIYFSNEEKESGDKLISNICGNKKYGFIGASSTYGKTGSTKLIIDKVKQYKDIFWIYYGENPIEHTDLNFIKNVCSIKNMNLSIREQMYLKINACVNIGNETGMSLWASRYTENFVLGHKLYGKIHGKKLEGKPRKKPFITGNFVKTVNYL